MKKYISFVLVLLLILSCFTGCKTDITITGNCSFISQDLSTIRVVDGDTVYFLQLSKNAELIWEATEDCLTEEQKKDWRTLVGGLVLKAHLTQKISENKKVGTKTYVCDKVTVIEIKDEFFENFKNRDNIVYAGKPVIYLYPEKETAVDVSLDFKGELTCTYPEYDGGWSVIAKPDGTLFDKDEKEYNYLYWEGTTDVEYDFSKGFCIKGEDSAKFLENALEKLGLTRREANEFIVYWLPLMEQNEYNVISFQTEAYTKNAELNISPAPDCMIRVFMAWYGVDKKIEIPEQKLSAPERHGFTVVEWGGSEVK